MPEGAAAQRRQTLATIDALLANALAGHTLPAPNASADAITQSAMDALYALAPAIPGDTGESPYQAMQRIFAQRSDLELAAEIIGWMQSTHSLPGIGDDAMEDASSALSIFMHRLLMQPAVIQWAHNAPVSTPDPETARNASLMRHQCIEESAFSEQFVDELSRVNLASFRIWETTKQQSDFAAWLPYFSEVVAYARKKAGILSASLQVSPYQALLDRYNPGLRNDTVNSIFTALHARLPALIATITAKQSARPIPLPNVAIAAQRRIIQRIIDALGFDPRHSRIDESMHPFSTGEWDDVRVTTRYHEDNLLSGIMSVVHEMGHLFYSRNLPRAWKHQPIGAAQSMWIHESQSLFWEKQIGCSRAFMQFLSPIIAAELGEGDAWSADNLYALITRVTPGLIRIEADEVTYPAHIILRHRLEQDLITGALAPADLPQAWNAQMQQLLAVTVPDHAHGCMQDVHWTDGSFGYFPAYTFGALAAAQFMQSARKALPDMDSLIATGNFTPILSWLNRNIHQCGSRYDGEELVARVTGMPLSIDPWLAHIDERYIRA
jgi:carboxypeptidase Taq